MTNDKFILIANSKKRCDVGIRTPWGDTEKRLVLNNIEMQGTVLAPLKCSVSIDKIGKEALENSIGNLFKYKNCVSIPPLSLIDDIIAITKCSSDAVVMNAYIETKTEDLQLQLGAKKCCQMHVGCKNSLTCPTLRVQNQEMMTSEKQQYLGDILSADGKIDSNITERYNKGVGVVNQIITLLVY